MEAEYDLDCALADWAQTLLRMEGAVQAADWPAANRLAERNSRQFDHLKALVEQAGPEHPEGRIRNVRQAAATLRRLTGLFEAWQEEMKTEIQGKRRGVRTAKAYHPVSAPGPQFLKVYADGTTHPTGS